MRVATAHRPSRARAVLGTVASMLAVAALAAGCTGGSSSPEESSPAASESAASEATASDSGGTAAGGSEGAADGGAGASDGGAATAVAVPQDPYPVTPAPEGFVPPEPCTGEGAYFTEVGTSATPDLPERAGESLTVDLVSIEGDQAQLRATIGDSPARDIEPMTLGEIVTLDLWTLSVTSVCEGTQQVEFDLID